MKLPDTIDVCGWFSVVSGGMEPLVSSLHGETLSRLCLPPILGGGREGMLDDLMKRDRIRKRE
jgi:hypothetical protein